MTTMTTVLGLTPLALSTGDGSELRAPLAITVMSGLLFATMLTLILIPVLYSLFDYKRYSRDVAEQAPLPLDERVSYE